MKGYINRIGAAAITVIAARMLMGVTMLELPPAAAARAIAPASAADLP